jgi:hypothetical protein
MFATWRTAYVIGAAALAVQLAAAQSQNQYSPYAQQQQSGCSGMTTTNQATGFANPSQRFQNRTGLSNAAVAVLSDTQQARRALSNGDRQTAINEIDRALQDARQARSLASSQGQGNLVPIYAEYAQSSVIGPIATARTAGGTQAAGAPAVQSVVGQYTSVAVDVPMAEQHLQAARTALLNNDSGAADSALKAVQDGVIMIRVESDMPLVQARQNLALARDMINQGNLQAARTPLREAVNALGQYSGAHARQAERLQLQIASLANNLPANRQADASRIDQWWNELADWTGAQPQQQQQQQAG